MKKLTVQKWLKHSSVAMCANHPTQMSGRSRRATFDEQLTWMET